MTKTVTVATKGWSDKNWTLNWLRKLGSYDKGLGAWKIEMNHPRATQLVNQGYVQEVAS